MVFRCVTVTNTFVTIEFISFDSYLTKIVGASGCDCVRKRKYVFTTCVKIPEK